MRENFFVTGYPRSRTAWMSVFLTTKHSFCYHEILRFSETISDIKKIMNKRDEFYVGNSGSDFPLFMERISFEPTPIVVIERNINDVKESLREVFGQYDTHILESIKDGLEVIKTLPKTIVVDYKDLDDEQTIKRVWKHCLPSIPFDKERWGMLKTLNISIDKNRYKRIKRKIKKVCES